MNIKILDSVWYVYNKYVKFNYDKIFPTNNVDIDTIILSVVDKNTLISLSTVNKYLAEIINNKSFWRLRMENRLGLISKDDNTNFRLITDLFDNSKSLRDNFKDCLAIFHKDYEKMYHILGENKIILYFDIYCNDYQLERKVIDIRKKSAKLFNENKEALLIIQNNIIKINQDNLINIKTKEFILEIISSINPYYDLTIFDSLTNIIEIKMIIYFDNFYKKLILRCNKPILLTLLLLELSQELEIKNISISNPENNLNITNELLYKTIERLNK